MNADEFDLIVIGSGPAGEKGAAQAAYFGKRVALIEKEQVPGGAAANTGTLPSKTLRESSLFLSGFRHRELKGLEFRLKDQVNISDFMARERIVVDTERTRIRWNMQRHSVEWIQGHARLVDRDTVAIHQADAPPRQIQGRVILIATGSRPNRPALFAVSDPRVCDSDSILSMPTIPRSLAVVGGGVIGCEYACMFAALGVQVYVIEQRDRVIGFMDHEISLALRSSMEQKGVRFSMNDGVEALDCSEPSRLRLKLKSGGTLDCDYALVSSGRNGNTRNMGLEENGVELRERGLIKVNEHYQSSVANIYAAGDVIGNPALASTSMEQARVAMVHAFDLKYKTNVAHILPAGIYTIPECSMAGMTEDELRREKIPYVVGRATYSQNARGQIIGDHWGFLKLIFHETDMRLLGVHMIGELATELIHIGLTGLLCKATADLFINTCYNYPTLSETYKYATYDALGNLSREAKEAVPS